MDVPCEKTGSMLNIYKILLEFLHFAQDVAQILQKRMRQYKNNVFSENKLTTITFCVINVSEQMMR